MDNEIFNNALKAIAKNKFLLTGALFFAWIALFDSNSWFDRNRLKKERTKLINEKAFYIEKIAEDSASLEELRTNNENLEKFARENFLMKKENEEVFVIVEGEDD
jgi:cell division protein DivIC